MDLMPAYPVLLFAALQEVVAHWIAESRIAIEKIRLLTLKAAHSIDTLGSAGAKKEVKPLGPLSAKPSSVSFTHWAFQVLRCLDGTKNIGNNFCDFGFEIINICHLLVFLSLACFRE